MTTSLHPAQCDQTADDLAVRPGATGPDPDATSASGPSQSGPSQVQVPIARSTVSALGEE